MELSKARVAVHQPDSTVPWAHPVFYSGSQPHNHVIPEARTPYEKSALGDHIDKYHAPVYTPGKEVFT